MAATSIAAVLADEATKKIFASIVRFTLTKSLRKAKYSVDAPPGKIEKRVFIGGNYVVMPILREIEKVVADFGFQPVIAYDFEIPLEKTREYTLRLLYQCRFAIFEETIGNGHLTEIARTSGFAEMKMLQVYMALDERKESPKTMSIMLWQSKPTPQGYVSIQELHGIVETFLSRY